MMGVVKQCRDGLAAAGIAGEDYITANVALDAMDMELFFKLLHSTFSCQIEFQKYENIIL